VAAYFDHAATAGMSAGALAAYDAAAAVLGNPSSLHANGRAARNIVEDARESIAADLGAHPTEIVFTSGGTEANNLAIKGIYWAQTESDPQRRGLLVSAMEHHSVLGPARWLANHGADLTVLPVTSTGQVELPSVEERLGSRLDTTVSPTCHSAASPQGADRRIHAPQAPPPALISVMLASNEIGTVQPIAEIAELARAAKVPMHTDAVAALGQIPISFTDLGVDALSVAAHKIGGPLGVGALLVKRGMPIEPLHHGGDQERGLRAGTINVPGVAAFAMALSIATNHLAANAARLSILRDQLIQGVQSTIPTAILTGPEPNPLPQQDPPSSCARSAATKTQDLKYRAPENVSLVPVPPSSCAVSGATKTQDLKNSGTDNRIPANASFVFPGCDPDALLFGLDNAGFAASIGAACAAGVAQASEALLACGFSDADARSSLRFTLGRTTSAQDVTQLIQILPSIVAAASS